MAKQEKLSPKEYYGRSLNEIIALAAKYGLNYIHEPDEDGEEYFVSYPEQAGLNFQIGLGLFGDELHLHVGVFHLEWFPASYPEVIDGFMDTIEGLILGTYRVREFRDHASQRGYMAYLEKEDNGKWKRRGSYSNALLNFLAWIPWLNKKEPVVLVFHNQRK